MSAPFAKIAFARAFCAYSRPHDRATPFFQVERRPEIVNRASVRGRHNSAAGVECLVDRRLYGGRVVVALDERVSPFGGALVLDVDEDAGKRGRGGGVLD